MESVKIYCGTVTARLGAGPAVADVTGALNAEVAAAGIREGVLSACVVGATGSLTTIEYEPGCVEDLVRAIERLAPPGADYRHELAWQDGNGHSHVQAALLGPSVSLAVRGGRLALGTWQQVVAVNHDIRPRRRRIEVTLIGR